MASIPNPAAAAAKPVFLATEPVTLGLPADAGVSAAGRVLTASLFPDNGVRPVAVWEFVLNPGGGGQLILSPERLDASSLILDHVNSPPLARRHQREPLPEGVAGFILTLEILPAVPGGQSLYRLNPRTGEFLERWGQLPEPVIDWFYVELTTYCNLSCPFCPSSILERPREFMPPELAVSVFQKIADYWSSRPRFIGYAQVKPVVYLHVMGEPLLHPQFVACVRAARNCGLVPALFTNATLLNEGNISKILESGIEHVTLSMNVVNAEAYRRLGARDSIEKQEGRALALLRALAERGAFNVHVDIQYMTSAGRTVVGPGTIETPQQFWRLYRRWLMVTRRHLTTRIPNTAGPQPMPEWGVLESPLAFGEDTSQRFPLTSSVDLTVKSGCSFGNVMLPKDMAVVPTGHGACPFGNPYRQMAVFVDGRVSFCSMDHEASVNLGNLAHQSVEDIWTSKRMRGIRSEMAQGILSEPLCQRCLGTVVPATADGTGAEASRQ